MSGLLCAASLDQARLDAKNAVYPALTISYNWAASFPVQEYFSGAHGQPTTSQDLLWWGAVRNTAGGVSFADPLISQYRRVFSPSNPLDRLRALGVAWQPSAAFAADMHPFAPRSFP
jgi:hypothetical protein